MDQPTDRPTNRPMDQRMDKAFYRVACPQLKRGGVCWHLLVKFLRVQRFIDIGGRQLQLTKFWKCWQAVAASMGPLWHVMMCWWTGSSYRMFDWKYLSILVAHGRCGNKALVVAILWHVDMILGGIWRRVDEAFGGLRFNIAILHTHLINIFKTRPIPGL